MTDPATALAEAENALRGAALVHKRAATFHRQRTRELMQAAASVSRALAGMGIHTDPRETARGGHSGRPDAGTD